VSNRLSLVEICFHSDTRCPFTRRPLNLRAKKSPKFSVLTPPESPLKNFIRKYAESWNFLQKFSVMKKRDDQRKLRRQCFFSFQVFFAIFRTLVRQSCSVSFDFLVCNLDEQSLLLFLSTSSQHLKLLLQDPIFFRP